MPSLGASFDAAITRHTRREQSAGALDALVGEVLCWAQMLLRERLIAAFLTLAQN